MRADRFGASVRIGAGCRPTSGAELIADSMLGDGAQILGRISATNVRLAGGAGHSHLDPDARGAVLKGIGTARGVRLAAGEVINSAGDLAAAPVERQLAYHPRPQAQ